MASRKSSDKDLVPQTVDTHESEIDEYGFGVNTVGSFVLHYLVDGSCTKAELLEAFMSTEWKGWGRGQETKRTKVSLSVFLSDVKRPFGRYHGARSIVVVEDPETHKLSVEPKSVARCVRAVKAGIMEELKGLNHRDHLLKLNLVRKKFGVPTE